LAGAFLILAVTGGAGATAQQRDWSVGEIAADQANIPDKNAVLSSQISKYRDLPDDWDGEGGHRPPAKAIDEALSFINFIPLGAPLPKTSVAGDGEVGFYWKSDKGFIDVSFYGDGHIYYYARIEGKDIDEDDAPKYTGRSIPKLLAAAIEKI